MKHEYRVEKRKFVKEEIEEITIFFDNGDYFNIDREEIVDISVRLYDRLIFDRDRICLCAASGFIGIRAQKAKTEYPYHYLYNESEYRKDRPKYISERLCNEGGIKYINIYNERNNPITLYGNFAAKAVNGEITVEISEQSIPSPSDGKENMILLREITKPTVDRINLIFENCDDFTVYRSEIIDMRLTLSTELVEYNYGYCREVRNGYIRILFDKSIPCRAMSMYADKPSKVKKLKRRLCRKNRTDIHDICYLQIQYGNSHSEYLAVQDIQDPDQIERLIETEDESDVECYYFQGGCCERLSDGTVLIAFGEKARKMLKNAESARQDQSGE